MRALALLLVCVACDKADPPAKPPDVLDGIELPRVTGGGFEPATAVVPIVGATPAALFVDGKQLLPITNGDVAPTAKQGGESGMKINPLTLALMQAREAASAALPPVPMLRIAFDKRMTYKLFLATLFSAKQKEAGWKSFQLLARAGDKLVGVPITLPDKAPASAASEGHGLRVLAPESRLTPDVVLAKIQSAYLAGINRCYKAALKKDGRAQGKVRLAITLTKVGIVKASDAAGFDAALDACIEKLMPAWRFPAPGDEAEFAITLSLIPDAPASPAPASPAPASPAPAEAPAGSGSASVAIEPAEPTAEPPPQPLQMIVTATKTEILVWSISQLEGSLREPKLAIQRADPLATKSLSAALAQIVARRWPDDHRSDDDRRIIVQVPGDTTMQEVATILGAVRATADGKPLFPDVALSSGFE